MLRLHQADHAAERERRLVAFVVRRGQPVRHVSLGACSPIDSAVGLWRQAVGAHRASEVRSATAELDRHVLQPLKPHLLGADTVLVAPDGVLGRIPFAVLPGSRPGAYLIDEMAVGYVASGRQAVEFLTVPQNFVGRGLLAAGGIDFATDPGTALPPSRPHLALSTSPVPVGAARAGFRPLPGTLAEAEAVGDLFQSAFANQPMVLLTGTRPTEAEMKKRLNGGRWRVLHLATHGFFESPARLAAFRRDDAVAEAFWAISGKEQDLAFELTPLLRSGIVLAGGAREPVASDISAEIPLREDGISLPKRCRHSTCAAVIWSCCRLAKPGLASMKRARGCWVFNAPSGPRVPAQLWRVSGRLTTTQRPR